MRESLSVLETAFTNVANHIGLDREARELLLASGESRENVQIRLINVYQLLVANIGRDGAAICHWLETYNEGLQARPFDLIKAETGLAAVEAYLSLFAGKW